MRRLTHHASAINSKVAIVEATPISTAMPISAGEHRQIVKAIASGNADVAGRAMYDHVIESKERTIENDLRRQARLQANPAAREAQAKAAHLLDDGASQGAEKNSNKGRPQRGNR